MDIENEIAEMFLGISMKEKLKYYIGITKEIIQKSNDMILLEKSHKNLKYLENTYLDLIMEEFYIGHIDRNN